MVELYLEQPTGAGGKKGGGGRMVRPICCIDMGVKPKMVGFPNKPMGFPTKNDHDLGCEMGGNPPFKETPIYYDYEENY